MTYNQRKKIAGNFCEGDEPKLIPRLMIRAYIFHHVCKTGEIMNLRKESINKVINYFKLGEKEKPKIKNMIREILKRDKSLPPIIFHEEMNGTTYDAEITPIIKRKAIEEPIQSKKICYRAD